MKLILAATHRLYGAVQFTLLYICVFAFALAVGFAPVIVLIHIIPPYQNGGWFLFAFAVVYPTYAIMIMNPMGKLLRYWVDLQTSLVATYKL